MTVAKARIFTSAFIIALLAILSAANAQVKIIGPRMGPVPAKAAQAVKGPRKSGLHIKKNRQVNFTYTMNDGAGYRWDIQRYGNVGQGTNNAYGSGMYCQVNGSNIRSNSNTAWLNAEGDELEIGPYQRDNITCYRRVKVYKDTGLARWLDIFNNNTGQDISVPVQMYTNTSWAISQAATTSGRAAAGPDDWGFVTRSGGNAPCLMHIFGDKRTKRRPNIRVQHNQIYLQWGNITVPAGKTVILCHFEAQNRSADELEKTMNTFKAYKMLKDLSPGVRKLIINFTVSSGFADVYLDRNEKSDIVFLRDGDVVPCSITSAEFNVETFLGKLKLPANQIIGMAAPETAEETNMRFLMTDGQVISGKVDETTLSVTVGQGDKLEIPIDRIAQWSFKISKERSEDIGMPLPALTLKTGDQFSFDPASLDIDFMTRYGSVKLQAADLMQIQISSSENDVHRAVFINGSTISGLVKQNVIKLKLKLGSETTIPRNLIVNLRFAEDDKPDSTLTQMALAGGDMLFGQMTDKKLHMQMDYGTRKISPATAKTIIALGQGQGKFVVDLWDGTSQKCRLKEEYIGFQISPGPKFTIHTSQIIGVARSQAMPPDEIIKKVEDLVARLSAESFQDRETASKELKAIGKGIIPLLKKYLNNKDPEVRQRIQDVIESLDDGSLTPVNNNQRIFLMRGG